MVGVTDGEYMPATPSCTASLPLAPEYFGWSNFPLSRAKCRCPSPAFGFFPTSFAERRKWTSLTLALTVLVVVAPVFGVTKLTPGSPVAASDWGAKAAGGARARADAAIAAARLRLVRAMFMRLLSVRGRASGEPRSGLASASDGTCRGSGRCPGGGTPLAAAPRAPGGAA